MKKFGIDAVLIAAFLAICAWPSLASLGPSFVNPADRMEVADRGPTAAERDTYAQQARIEVQEWRVEIDRLSADARARSARAWKTASEDLNASWIRTRDASDRLRQAGKAGWNSARDTYNEAADELLAKWAKLRADEKQARPAGALERAASPNSSEGE
jgi:hypothetical protein